MFELIDGPDDADETGTSATQPAADPPGPPAAGLTDDRLAEIRERYTNARKTFVEFSDFIEVTSADVVTILDDLGFGELLAEVDRLRRVDGETRQTED